MSTPSQRSRGISHFLVMEILERAHALEARGHDVVHLEVGEPDFDTPAVARSAGIDAIDSGRTHYTHSLGLPALRDGIAARYAREHDVTVDPDRVVVTLGSSAALLLCFAALLDPGDEVIVSDPGYACYPNIARTLGASARAVPVRAEDAFVYDPDAVAAAITDRTKAIVVNSPANPTGTITPPDTLAALAGSGLPLVSDEIYHGLVYEGSVTTALAVSDDAFVVNGFSKRYAMTGWRLGYAIVPPEHLRTVQAMQQNLFISASDFGQHAAAAALTADGDVEAMRVRFDERRRFLLDALPKIGLDVPARPQGAFYVFADARPYTDDSLAFANAILDEVGVAVTPGVDFGRRGEGFIRVSYATALDRIEEGVRRLEKFLSAKPRVS